MSIIIANLQKKYADKVVIADYHLTLDDGHVYCITAPSGAGKTTLFRILSGLEKADGGTISGVDFGKISYMFQEDRLLPKLSAVENVSLLQGINKENAREELEKMLPHDSLDKPARELSGGMKRRVALVRAMIYDSELVLLDEPFTGLDQASRDTAIKYILENQRGRTVIVATHEESDIEKLKADRIVM